MIQPDPAANDDTAAWANRAAIIFLSLLSNEAGLSDQGLLEEFKAAGLWGGAADLLVELGRIPEATALAGRRLQLTVPLIQFAEGLFRQGEEGAAAAVELVEGRLWENEGKRVRDDARLLERLERAYGARGMEPQALEIAKRRFAASPDVGTYQAVKAAATMEG